MSCIICNSQNIRILFFKNTYQFNKCSTCNFIFISPKPSSGIINSYYKKFTYDTGFKNEKVIRKDAKKTLQILAKLINKGTLLDIGCGAGFFLDEARKSGWQIEGVDMSGVAVKYAKEKLSIPTKIGDFLKLEYMQKRYDVVVLNQVIEHLINPFPVLIKAIALLKQDGILLVATPNNNSVMSYVQKEKFNYVTPPEHILYFSPNNLKLLINKLNCKTLKIRTWSYPADFAGVGKYLFKGKDNMESQIVNTTNKNLVIKQSNMKKIKSWIYDGIISNMLYKLLNVQNHGSMLEIYAQKI